jgi:hypothetical protein
MASRRSSARPRKKRSVLLPMLLALALLLAWWFRGCFGLDLGLGFLNSLDGERVDAPPPVIAPGGDASQAPGGDAGQLIATACELELSATGLTVKGEEADIDAAVDACRRAGKASLRVTGDARTGAYLELKRALEQAGVPLDERQWPERE